LYFIPFNGSNLGDGSKQFNTKEDPTSIKEGPFEAMEY
jgi:hypothetical protein